MDAEAHLPWCHQSRGAIGERRGHTFDFMSDYGEDDPGGVTAG